MVLDTFHLTLLRHFHMNEVEFGNASAEYLGKVWFGSSLQSAKQSGGRSAVVRAIPDAKLDWHDVPGPAALARQLVCFPLWITDDDLARLILPLGDSHDILTKVYGSDCCTPEEAVGIEDRMLLDLQASEGLNVLCDNPPGLGWSRHEILWTEHYVPAVVTRTCPAPNDMLSRDILSILCQTPENIYSIISFTVSIIHNLSQDTQINTPSDSQKQCC
ncbi:nonribosomal peptide synthetase [Ceratobasidium sp. AG-Ba]|nr:nonribosomal peptide synthetase [Ceratobasidium sp. AG-Ba]